MLQNNPLYLEVFDSSSGEDTLQFHHIVHCSLDAVEGRSEQSYFTQYKCHMGSVHETHASVLTLLACCSVYSTKDAQRVC